MEELLEIDLIEEDDLLERYNRKKVSKKLLEYIIDTSLHFNPKSKIKIIINNKLDYSQKCSPLIFEGLKNEYNISYKNQIKTNIIQFIYFIVGCLILFLSTLVTSEVLREVILIGGWVFIWAMVELEIFTDLNEKKKRKIIKKLLCSEYIENN